MQNNTIQSNANYRTHPLFILINDIDFPTYIKSINQKVIEERK